MEEPWNQVAARTGILIDEHGLGAEDGLSGFGLHRAVRRIPVIPQRPLQILDDVVRGLAAAIESIVDDHALFADLCEKVAIERGVTASRCVGQIDIGDFAAAQLVHFAKIAEDPIAASQRDFAADGNDDHVAAIGAVRIRPDLQRDLLACGIEEEADRRCRSREARAH